ASASTRSGGSRPLARRAARKSSPVETTGDARRLLILIRPPSQGAGRSQSSGPPESVPCNYRRQMGVLPGRTGIIVTTDKSLTPPPRALSSGARPFSRGRTEGLGSGPRSLEWVFREKSARRALTGRFRGAGQGVPGRVAGGALLVVQRQVG